MALSVRRSRRVPETGRAMITDADMSLFAGPRITMHEREDGCLLLESADPLQDYPGTVVHSVWAWAAADPDYPLAAERGTDGSCQPREKEAGRVGGDDRLQAQERDEEAVDGARSHADEHRGDYQQGGFARVALQADLGRQQRIDYRDDSAHRDVDPPTEDNDRLPHRHQDQGRNTRMLPLRVDGVSKSGCRMQVDQDGQEQQQQEKRRVAKQVRRRRGSYARLLGSAEARRR